MAFLQVRYNIVNTLHRRQKLFHFINPHRSYSASRDITTKEHAIVTVITSLSLLKMLLQELDLCSQLHFVKLHMLNQCNSDFIRESSVTIRLNTVVNKSHQQLQPYLLTFPLKCTFFIGLVFYQPPGT